MMLSLKPAMSCPPFSWMKLANTPMSVGEGYKKGSQAGVATQQAGDKPTIAASCQGAAVAQRRGGCCGRLAACRLDMRLLLFG